MSLCNKGFITTLWWNINCILEHSVQEEQNGHSSTDSIYYVLPMVENESQDMQGCIVTFSIYSYHNGIKPEIQRNILENTQILGNSIVCEPTKNYWRSDNVNVLKMQTQHTKAHRKKRWKD